MPEIGASLREARMRARIDVSEIEAQTKIKARYLRALENEEWDLLPGPTFIKSFLRTYATALGLDGKALVEEYRVHYEHPGEQEAQPLSASRRRSRPGNEGAGSEKASRGYMVTVGLIAVLIVVLVIGLLSRGSSPKKTGDAGRRQANAQARRHGRAHAHAHRGTTTVPAAGGKLTLTLEATATVWVCLLGDSRQKLIPGVDLQAGETSGPFHARRFEMTLGNASVSMRVNGRPLSVPASTRAIGYQVTSAGATPLPPARQPTCA